MPKANIMEVLALAMCGLALVCVVVIYHGTRMVITLRSVPGKCFWGVVILCALIISIASIHNAATLLGVSEVEASFITILGIFATVGAFLAAAIETDKQDENEALAIVPAK